MELRAPRLWLHGAIVAGTFGALFVWTWGIWPDVLIDFGRELYVPWRISLGARLFADIAWLNGPLSPYWNALIMGLAGPGLSPIVGINAAIFGLIVFLIHGLLRSISTSFAATTACLTIMALCGFGQLVGTGNYNFMTPYSHETTHGLLLALGGLAASRRIGRLHSPLWMVAAGGCLGLAFLTKPEIFAAAAVGAAVTLFFYFREKRMRAASELLGFFTGAAVPIAGAWLLLSLSMDSSTALRGVLGAWPSLGGSPVLSLDFYRRGMGLEAPLSNLSRLLFWSLGIGALLLPGALISRLSRGAIRPIAMLTALGTLLLVAWLHRRVSWIELARPWPLIAATILLLSIRAAWKRPSQKLIGAASFAAFSLVLLGKMLLNARLAHYGFVLALPATALLVVALVDWIPRKLEPLGFQPLILRSAAVAALVGVTLIHLNVVRIVKANKRVEIATGRDRFLADGRGHAISSALAWLEARASRRTEPQTLVVMPEGVMLNYLARLENPTPYTSFMPLEVMVFGERSMLASLAAEPPDYVLFAHKSTIEYGVPWFGTDYAREIAKWVEVKYEPVALFGDAPFEPRSRFGVRVLRRRIEIAGEPEDGFATFVAPVLKGES